MLAAFPARCIRSILPLGSYGVRADLVLSAGFESLTLFLKTPRRIMALMAIMTLCLLVYAAVQWRVPQAFISG